MNYQNVTRIDDLPELEDIDTHFNKEHDERNHISSNYKKFIRNTNPKNMNPISGMNGSSVPNYTHTYNNGSYPMGKEQQVFHQEYPHSSGGFAPNSQMFYEPYDSPQVSCVSVADHALSCPVCSKLYNNDRTVYIIAIIILIIICILLLKRILEF